MIRWATLLSSAQKLVVVELAKRAVDAAPDSPHLHVLLSSALVELGDTSEARCTLERAHVRFSEDAGVGTALGKLLIVLGDAEAAHRLAHASLAQPWAAKLALKLAARSHGFGIDPDLEQAVAAADPGDPILFDIRAQRLRSNPEALLRLCNEQLAIRAFDAGAIHFKIVALAMLGRGDDAAALLGTDRFLRSGDLPAPLGEPVVLERLAAEIERNPSLHPDPVGHAQRHGLRTRMFPAPADEAGPDLLRELRRLVSDYAAELGSKHPFAVARPAQAVMTAWALLFRAAGHQVAHVHPHAWLTGVCYVAAPAGEPRPGTLRVGALPEWAGIATPWPILEFEPRPGSYVLFPAFTPHETMPTGSDELRIAIAFDVSAS